MTNEELAMLIKSGHKEYYSQLWDGTYRLFALRAYKFYNHNENRCKRYGVEESDLLQSCFYALVLAVNAYSPESGFAFTTYTNYHINNIFKSMVNLRGKKLFDENNCTSLNHIVDDEETELGELLPDVRAQEDMERVEYDITIHQLSELLEDIIGSLPTVEEGIIKELFYNQKTYAQAGEVLGLTRDQVRLKEGAALRHIRHSKRYTELEPFRDELIGSAYHSTGLSSFRRNNASSVEIALERAERARRRAEMR